MTDEVRPAPMAPRDIPRCMPFVSGGPADVGPVSHRFVSHRFVSHQIVGGGPLRKGPADVGRVGLGLVGTGLACLLLLGPHPSLAGSDPAAVQASRLKAHVERLASDSFYGRGTGEVGTRLAEEYVAEQFRDLGLVPVPGEQDFFLEFPLYTSRPDTQTTTLEWRRPSTAGGAEAAGGRGVVGTDFRPFPFSDSGEATAGVVFAGYGISAPELGYDDYARIDVEGRFVLVLRHEPGETDPASPFDGRENSSHALFTTKAEVAARHGAIGMILVTDPRNHDESEDFRLQSRLFLDPDLARGVAEVEGEIQADENPEPFLAVHVSREVARDLLTNSDRTLDELQERIDRDFEPESFSLDDLELSLSVGFDTEPTRIEARNVAGFLPGRDPDRVDEWIVVGAHHDHLGAFVGPGDTIFNGADDNASGVAGVLELAEAFALRDPPPRRSIVFATFAAEEIGLLGSRAMVEQEQIPVDQVVFLLNMDMLGRNPDRPVSLTGDGYAPGLAEIVDAEFVRQSLAEEADAKREGRDVERLEIRLAGLDYMGNTDHAPFFARGIPFLTFFTGLHADYHQLSDHPELLDFPRMESIVRLAGSIVGRIAEQPDALPFLHDISWLGLRVEALRGSERAAAVSFIDDGSQAQLLGLRVGDRFHKINEREVDPPGEIGDRLAEVPPGASAEITFRRGDDLFSIIAHRAHPGYLGIFPGSVDNDLRRDLALKADEGVLVRDVVEAGPAETAGLRRGDILVEVGGRTVDDQSLRGRLAQIGAGEKIDLILVRNGERTRITMTLGERPQGG